MYTIRQAARKANFTYDTLRQYAWRGVVKTITDIDGHIWITDEELQRVIARDLPPTATKPTSKPRKKADRGRPIVAATPVSRADKLEQYKLDHPSVLD